jgi:hypothetical protein
MASVKEQFDKLFGNAKKKFDILQSKLTTYKKNPNRLITEKVFQKNLKN